jgi:phenylalanyl-tRNA synthetase beta chain
MKISLNQIRYYRDQYNWSADPAPDGVDALIERIGAQLGAVEGVENIGLKYQGVRVAKVVDCRKHENSDHLNICTIDDGGVTPDVPRDEHGYVQVVCGAPNVRTGLTVAWLPPGATVPESVGKDPFVLEAREIRGELSNGMLASPKELALSESHDGILELDGDAKPGDDFAKAYGLDDYIIDLENKMFTHRPDCFGMFGIAREIAGIQGQAFKSPDWYVTNPAFPAIEADPLPLQVRNEVPELAPRFTAITMRDVKVGASPTWLVIELSKLGQRSINNIVDYTNYFMLITGQPLHAYDYDKVRGLDNAETARLTVRLPRESERITLLNGKEINPRQEAIMIATDTSLIGLAGIMGGQSTETDENTKNIILECANFDMYSVRRTSMEHGIFTDALTRFNKGQSPLQNLAVLAKLVDEIRQHAGGRVASDVIDDNHLSEAVMSRGSLYPAIPITGEFINARLGLDLPAEQMKTLLENVEFKLTVESDALTVQAPFWRTDVETREDVVEEVGRLYGFDKLPLVLPRHSITPATKEPLLELKAKVRGILARAGANEVLTYSFVHGDLLEKAGQDKAHAYQISNALSPELQYFRLSLTPSLLDKIHPNIKAGYDRFAIFEIGKGHNLNHTTDDLPMEFEMLDLVYTASDKIKKPGAAYYQARTFLAYLANELGLQLEYRPIENEEDYPVAKPYDHTRSASVWVKDTDIALGMIGEYKASVRKALKLPVHTAGFGIGLAQLMEAAKNPTIKWYYKLSRFPGVTQDMTLKVASDTPFAGLRQFLLEKGRELRPEDTTSQWHTMDIYQSETDKTHKNITFRYSVVSHQRTLTDTEVVKLLDAVAEAAKNKFGAERI